MSVENDEITIKFRFTRNGGLEFIGLDAFREATFESAISRMSTMIFLTLLPLSRNTNHGRLHRTGRKRTLRGKCLVPYGRGPRFLHEAKAMLFCESAECVESNGKRGFICRENTLRNEIKYHAAGR